jgi:transposase
MPLSPIHILNETQTPPLPPLDRPQTPLQALHSHTTRDERLQVQTLRDTGFNYSQISSQLNLTLHQVAYASNHRLTPKMRSGRPSTLTEEEVEEVIRWVCASKANRRAPWVKIPIYLDLNVSHYAVRNTLQKAGFSRRVARRKPPISERNRQARLRWAIEHVEWTIEQWREILWSDETWANGD